MNPPSAEYTRSLGGRREGAGLNRESQLREATPRFIARPYIDRNAACP